jgi:hypothetical protein
MEFYFRATVVFRYVLRTTRKKTVALQYPILQTAAYFTLVNIVFVKASEPSLCTMAEVLRSLTLCNT